MYWTKCIFFETRKKDNKIIEWNQLTKPNRNESLSLCIVENYGFYAEKTSKTKNLPRFYIFFSKFFSFLPNQCTEQHKHSYFSILNCKFLEYEPRKCHYFNSTEEISHTFIGERKIQIQFSVFFARLLDTKFEIQWFC